MSGDERLRLFLALRLPAAALDALADWQARELESGERTPRIVPRENLHVTLAFLGSRPAAELPAILDVLGRAASATEPLRFDVTGYRETRSVGMLTLGGEVGAAATLADRLHAELAGLGVYRPEARPWLPHVTVLRFRERPRLRPEVAPLGWVSSDAAAFLSRLHPSGARYEVHDSFPLGG
ncbi:MAG TPA: RNA 2',3'-cyclic phosphodiesterase [Gaiellaceae bacterium]|nr:RNA 2',3'-cyclic phosphodiesterase [Gaiellaceae bacterium]